MNKENNKAINVIDVIIIAVIIIAIAAAAFIFLRPQNLSAQDTQYIDFTIELPTIKNEFADLVKKYDPVLETVRHTTFGYVLDVLYEDAVIATTDMSNGGVMSMSPYPDHKRAEITIRAPYTINENGEYSVNGTTVAVGAYLNFSTPDFITSGYCVKVRPLTDTQASAWEKILKDIGGNR